MAPASKTNYHLHSFFPNTIKEWNSPPLNVVEGRGTIHKLFPRPAEHAFILLFFSYHQLLPLLKPLTSCQESSYRWRASPWKIIKIYILGLCHMHSVLYRLLSTTHLRKMVYSHRGTGGGGGGGWTPLEFLICCSISKRFYLQWKPFDLLYKMRYIWRCWGTVTSPTKVAILAAILDFTKN